MGGGGQEQKRGEREEKRPVSAGSRLCTERAPERLWVPARARGRDISISPGWLKESWGEGVAEAGKERKENKLCSPLNIHDSSFAKANGKHINPFTTLLNAKEMDEGHSMLWAKLGGIGKSGPQEAGISGRGGRLWAPLASIPGGWIPAPFIPKPGNQTLLSSTTLRKVITFLPEVVPFPLRPNI